MEVEDSTSSARSSTAYVQMPLGTVIRTHVIDTEPPKTKIFIIVGYYEDKAITIYFNSEVNHFINYSQELQSLHIHFPSNGRAYLTKDCYCDCSYLSLKNKDELHAIVKANPAIHTGNLSREDLDTVMITLRNSPKIKGTYKNRYGFYMYETLQ